MAVLTELGVVRLSEDVFLVGDDPGVAREIKHLLRHLDRELGVTPETERRSPLDGIGKLWVVTIQKQKRIAFSPLFFNKPCIEYQHVLLQIQRKICKVFYGSNEESARIGIEKKIIGGQFAQSPKNKIWLPQPVPSTARHVQYMPVLFVETCFNVSGTISYYSIETGNFQSTPQIPIL